MSGKRYPEEFKIEAVKQVIDRGHSVSSVATRLGITTDLFPFFSQIEQTGFMFDNGIGSMKHESYLVFCIRIRHPYQNR